MQALAGIEKDAADEDPVAAALAMLALVAGQDVEPAEGSDGTDGRWRIARKVAPDRVISQVDPQARHTRKSPEARRDGYRAHVVAEPETGIITDEALTMAAGPRNSDAAVAEQFLANDSVAGPGARQWYGDCAYGTGDLRGVIRDAGHDAVIKPEPLTTAVQHITRTGRHCRTAALVQRPVPAQRGRPAQSACLPMLADLKGLPPAHLVAAEADPLLADGDRFARRLREAGVAVTARTFPGMFRGFVNLPDRLPCVERYNAEIYATVRATIQDQ